MREKVKAIALKYDPEYSSAPSVTAKGQGWVAEKLIRLAKEKGVPVREDSDLVEILSRLSIGDEIPEEVFAVVAEILATVILMREEAGVGSPGGET